MLATTAFADMGPKPSVEVVVEQPEGERVFYATLLSKEKSTGPHSAVQWDAEELPPWTEGMTQREESIYASSVFACYQDPDGYYFLGEQFYCTRGSFKWGYYPPHTFKILLWFPDTGELICSESMERFAFESCFRVTFSEGGLKVSKDFRIPSLTLAFLARVAATLLLELALAIAFGYFRKGFRCIVTINLITQIALNVVLALVSRTDGGGFFSFLWYVGMEIGILLAEWFYYRPRLPQTNPKHPGKGRVFLYALLANLLSFFGGFLLMRWLPMVF